MAPYIDPNMNTGLSQADVINNLRRAGLYNESTGQALPSVDQTAINTSILPQTGDQSNQLLNFKNTFEQVVNVAKQKRNELLGGALMQPLQGTVAASDFNSIISNLNTASDTTTSKFLEAIIPKKPPTDIVDVGGRKLLVNTDTGDTIKDLGASSTGGTGSNQITDNERALMGVFISNPIVKNYNELISQKNYTDRIISNGIGGPADLALVYTFMKGLDPNSVVRESEYDMAAKSGNIFKGWAAKFNGYLNENGGILPDNVKTEFQNLVNQRLQAQQLSYDNFAGSIRAIAERQGLNPDNVVPNFGGAINKTILYSPDGTQQVNVADLTPAQIKEAEAAGWK